MSTYPIDEKNKVKRIPKRGHYDQATVHEILDAGFLCHLGFTHHDQPFVIPTSYGREGNKIYLHGATTSRMMVNLEKGLPVCLTVTHLDGLVLARSAFHHSANYRSVNVFGKVRKVDDPIEKMNALACILNHMVPEHWDNVRQPNDKEFNATLVIAIKIDTASAKVRAEGVVDEKEDHSLPIWAGVIPIRQVASDPVTDADLQDDIEIPDTVLKYVKSKG